MKAAYGLVALITLTALVLCWAIPAAAAKHNHIEDFTSEQYKDPVHTTAWWDTVAGELKLPPYEISTAGQYFFWGNVGRDIAPSGDYAYVATASLGLLVLDISNPESPTLEGSYNTPGYAVGIDVCGDYAYVADGDSGLQIIDISDPANPAFAGSYIAADEACGICVSGDLAYVACKEAGLIALDVSDPANPILLDSWINTFAVHLDVEVSGDYAYVADHMNGLHIVDISDPTNLSRLGGVGRLAYPYEVAVSGDIVLMADSQAGIQVIDVSDPTNPVRLGVCNTELAYGVDFTGDYAYVTDYYTTLVAIDFSDPANPTIFETYDLSGGSWSVAVEGRHAFIAEHDWVTVANICELTPLAFAGRCDSAHHANHVKIAGDYCYVADGEDGLTVLNITDPVNPSLAGRYDTPGGAGSVDIAGDYAFVTDGSVGKLQVIDISDPTNPAFAGSYDTLNTPYYVEVAGNYAYIADPYASSLVVVDITDPTNPVSAGSLNLGQFIRSVTVDGDYAYLAGDVAGLYVIDIHDPTSPTQVGLRDLTRAMHVTVSGDHAFVADENSGFRVIDVSDPSNPTIAGTCNTPGNARGVEVSGDYAFVADGSTGGVHVIDISDPSSPAIIDTYFTPAYAGKVTLAGDYLYVANGDSGMHVVQVFQRWVNPADSTGQSLAVNPEAEEISKVMLTAEHTDSIRWEVSSNGGANWQEIIPDGAVNTIAVPGSSLVWRSNHIYSYAAPGVNPTCTSLDITWLHHFPHIDSIVDVPGDQGGWVRVYFARSDYDFADEPTYPVTGYFVFSRIDDPVTMMNVREYGTSMQKESLAAAGAGSNPAAVPRCVAGAELKTLGERRFLVSAEAAANGLPPGVWEVVGSVPAHQEDRYICRIPSAGDSSSSVPYTVLCVSAETTTPSVYFLSPPDSGYSVDNIAPSAPTGFAVAYNTGSGTQLGWDACPDEDFHYFRVYRGESEDFEPAPGNLVHSTIETDWLDTVEEGWRYHYKISAVDYDGNESDHSPPETVTGAEESETPAAFALYQNAPNPFNPATAIAFDLPRRTSVRLSIYDVQGRLIRVLLDETMSAGRKTARWDGTDASGGAAASGIYFYRLVTPEFTQARKMVLLR